MVVVNAAKLKVTGAKDGAKMYYRHTSYPGGIKESSFGKMQGRFPGRALEIAVKGMLPKGRWDTYAQEAQGVRGRHAPHTAQQPRPLEI